MIIVASKNDAPDIRILAGLAGGGTLSGDSGGKIKDELDAIAQAISNKGGIKVKFGVDANSIKTIQDGLRKISESLDLSVFQKAKGAMDTLIKAEEILYLKAETRKSTEEANLVVLQQKRLEETKALEDEHRKAMSRLEQQRAKNANAHDKRMKELAEERREQAKTHQAAMDKVAEDAKANKKTLDDELARIKKKKAEDDAAHGDAMQDLKEKATALKSFFELASKGIKTQEALRSYEHDQAMRDINERKAALKGLFEVASKGIKAQSDLQTYEHNQAMQSVRALNTVINLSANISGKRKKAEKEAAAQRKKAAADREKAAKQEEARIKKQNAERDKALRNETLQLRQMQSARANAALLIQQFPKMQSNDDFKAQFDGIVRGMNEGTLSAQAANAQLATLRKNLVAAGYAGKTLGDQFKSALGKFVQYIGVSSLVLTAMNSVRTMIRYVTDLDASVTDLQIASGKSRKAVVELMDSYHDLGKQIGAFSIDVAASADTWLRQGYSIEQSNKLIKDSMMLSKLGQIESAEASKALTSAMKGYKVSVEDATSVVDKFTAVDLEAATSAGDIATAMSQTAVSANVAGISMDRLIGYLATVQEVNLCLVA